MEFNRNTVLILIATFLFLPACEERVDASDPAPSDSAALAIAEESPEHTGGAEVEEVVAEVELPTEPAQWRWKLEEGQTLSLEYRSVSDTSVEIPGMGGAIRDRITVNTDMDLRVRRVMPDGRYDLEIPVRRMIIDSDSGQRMTLDDLPPEVGVLRAYLSPLGKVEFYERVVVEVRDNGVYGLLQMSGDGQGGTSTATFNDGEVEIEVTASATIDPATGQVRLSGGIRERAVQPRTRKVEEEHQVQHIDVLPADILSLLELPEGLISPGFKSEIDSPIGVFAVEAGEPRRCGNGGCGVLGFTVDGEVEMDGFMGGGNPAMAMGMEMPDLGGMDMNMDMGMDMNMDMGMDMNMDMPDLGGLLGGGGAKGGAADSNSMSLKFNSDVTMLFDVAAGRTYEISGTYGSQTSVMGLKTDEKTEFTLSISSR